MIRIGLITLLALMASVSSVYVSADSATATAQCGLNQFTSPIHHFCLAETGGAKILTVHLEDGSQQRFQLIELQSQEQRGDSETGSDLSVGGVQQLSDENELTGPATEVLVTTTWEQSTHAHSTMIVGQLPTSSGHFEVYTDNSY